MDEFDQFADAEDEFAGFADAPVEPEKRSSALGSNSQNLAAGVGRGVVQGGLALKGLIDDTANYLASTRMGGAVDRFGQSLGMPSAQMAGDATKAKAEELRGLDAELMGTTAGKIGNVAGMIGILAPTMLVPGANTYAGAALTGGGAGFALTPGDLKERATAGALGFAGGLAGQAAGQGIAAGVRALAGRSAKNLSAQQAANSVRDQSLAAGRDLGMVVPPTMANPSLLNQALEGFAGKITTGQRASQLNQGSFNAVAARSIGLPAGAPLTPQALREIRQQAGQAYQALDQVPIQADSQYIAALNAITNRQSNANAAFPGIANDRASEIVRSLSQPQFTGGQATATISLLRDQAKAAFQSGDPSLARSFNQASDALEDVIERNLQGQGSPELLTQYRDARRLIATTYTIERALNEGTGNIAGNKLASMIARGKPLQGELRDAARFAQAFPTASRETLSSMPGISPLDAGVAAIAPNGIGWGSLIGRPLARGLITSRPYQALMTTPSYASNRLAQAGGEALQSPVTQNLLARALPAYLVQQE